MRTFDVPGLSMAIVHEGRVVLARGYGVREQGKPDPVDEHTVFAIASNTKAFVTTALGLLVAEGKLDWDDRVVDRLPGFRTWDEFTTHDLRIRDLVCHRSGLATWAGDLAWIGSKIDTPELMASLPKVPASSPLRARYGYTNLMFVVAGEVIRAVTGSPWETVVRERLLAPLEMKRTTVSVTELADQQNVAAPHMWQGKQQIVVPYLNVDVASAAGSLNSSAADMARWVQLQLGNGRLDDRQIVPAEVVAALRVPHTPIAVPKDDPLGPTRHFLAYGLGWFLYDYHGRLVVTHSGGLPGMRSRVGLVPEADLGVVVLTNSESPIANVVFQMVMDAYLDVPQRDLAGMAKQRLDEARAETAAADPQPFEPQSGRSKRYVGSYRNPLLGRAVVTLGNAGLALQLPDHGGLDCPLTPIAADTFRCVWSNPIFGQSDIAFETGRTRATSLRLRVRPDFIDPLEYAFDRR
jgi:CubicO group peptidase (beta-lactamase class C family)